LAACVDAPVAPGAVGQTPTLSVADAQVVQAVTGNGHVVGARTYTFTVRKLADGTVTGWYHVQHRGKGGTRLWVAPDCLHVVGNKAWISGVVVSAMDPGNVGQPYAFRVVDTGEGANAAPDSIQTSGIGVFNDCASEWDLGPGRALTIGNIHVRG
jgi:hypothetical protein